MSRLILPSYVVTKDTREQKGWDFDAHHPERRSPRCAGMVIDTLQTGDYSLVGYTDILTIERKADFSELWGNYAAKRRPAFEDEMKRMSSIKYAYIVIESSMTPDILELSPPQFSKGVPGKSLIRWLLNLSIKHGVPVFFAGQCGRKVAQLIFEEVVRVEKDRWVSRDTKKNQSPSADGPPKGDYFGR